MVAFLSQMQASHALVGKKALIFGAFGWSAGAAKEISDLLKGCGCEIFQMVTW